jgi:hypothetical protein
VQKCNGQGCKGIKGTECRDVQRFKVQGCSGAEVGRGATQVQGKGQYKNESMPSHILRVYASLIKKKRKFSHL